MERSNHPHHSLVDKVLSLTDSHPELCKEWHKKNKHGPEHYTSESRDLVWWRCRLRNCEWRMIIASRVSQEELDCPKCSGAKSCQDDCLAYNDPHGLCQEWDYEANGETLPETIHCKSGKKVGWKCIRRRHKWTRGVAQRQKTHMCPECRFEERCLANNDRYGIVKEWHPTRNGKLTPYMVAYGSNLEVWWLCAKGHVWKASVRGRNGVNNKGMCPCCLGARVCIDNCLATLKPEHAAEWHPTKNGELTPYDVTACAQTDVWWLCKINKDHEWCISPHRKQNCPCCAGRKVCTENCLATRRPEIASLWHPTRNGDLTPNDVTAGAETKVWWLCREGTHERFTDIWTMCNGSGFCGKCNPSRGEAQIKQWLDKHENTYEREKTYDELVDRYRLRLDFVVFHETWTLIIEIDGQQHFNKNIDFGSSRWRDFEGNTRRDLMKTRFAWENGMCLLRITYYELDHLNELLEMTFAMLEDATVPFAVFSNPELYADHIKIWEDTHFVFPADNQE